MFEFKNLYKSYNGRTILNNLSYKFNNTGFVMLLGKSGGGKTTLLSVLTGLVKKDSGKIIYNNKELITDKDFANFRNNIAYVFQEYGVINYLTCYENLLLGGQSYNKKIDFLDEKSLFKKAGVLSGGEKQRLALIKALSKESSIIFCDEPTGSLDEDTGIKIMDKLKEVSLNKLVIMVTHNEELAYKYGDEILYLSFNELKVKRRSKKINKEIKIKKNKLNLFNGIKIAFKSFLQEKVKLFFSFLSLSLTITTFLTLGTLKESSYSSIKDNISTYADFTRLKVSEITDSKIDNTNFSLSKTTCPSLKDVGNIVGEYGEISYSFDTFFSSSEIYCKNIKLDVSIIVIPFKNENDDIKINNNLFEEIKNISDTINIRINKQITTKYNNKIVEDSIMFSLELKVSEVYNEFSFFNYPVIYISQQSVNRYLKSIKLKNLSKLTNSKNVTLYDRYTILTDKEDYLNNYCLYVDVYNSKNVFNVINLLKDYKNNDSYYEVESRAKITHDTLYSSLTLIELLMGIFSIVSLVVCFILLYLFMNYMYEKRKKEFSLYKTMGLRFKTIYLYNIFPLLIFGFVMLLTSFIMNGYLNIYLGEKLKFFFGFNILSNNDFILNNIHFIILCMIFSCLIIAIYPTFRAQFIKVNEVIKSE